MKHLLVIPAPASEGRPEAHILKALTPALTTLVSSNEWRVSTCLAAAVHYQLGGDAPRAFYSAAATAEHLAEATRFFGRILDDPPDVVLFIDAWSPLIGVYRYLEWLRWGRQRTQLCGIWHSSIGVPGEFFADAAWGHPQERTLLVQLDEVFVATKWSKLCVDGGGAVRVTGLPLPPDFTEYQPHAKDKVPGLIVWPHRWAPDKGIERLPGLAEMIAEEGMRLRVLHPHPLNLKGADLDFQQFCAERGVDFVLCPDRRTYRKYLQQAEVVLSTAILETFGYAVLEGAMCGAKPWVPDFGPYAELYQPDYRYDSHLSARRCVRNLQRMRRQKDPPSSVFMPGVREAMELAPKMIVQRAIRRVL